MHPCLFIIIPFMSLKLRVLTVMCKIVMLMLNFYENDIFALTPIRPKIGVTYNNSIGFILNLNSLSLSIGVFETFVNPIVGRAWIGVNYNEYKCYCYYDRFRFNEISLVSKRVGLLFLFITFFCVWAVVFFFFFFVWGRGCKKRKVK